MCAALGLAIGAAIPNAERAMTAGIPIMPLDRLGFKLRALGLGFVANCHVFHRFCHVFPLFHRRLDADSRPELLGRCTC